MKRFFATIFFVMTAVVVMAQTKDNKEEVVKCAQEGDAACQNMLGKWIYEGSHGYAQDYAKAVKWWMESAKQDNDEAISNLGFCYMYGMGVDADSVTAARLFEKAMKLGNKKVVAIHDSLSRVGVVFSSLLLGKSYKLGYGVARNEASALRYFKKAADRGSVDGMREAAILMRNAKDDANALALFKKAMQKGDVTATYYYGKMLCEGRGTAKDVKSGVAYLKQAAEKDFAAAQYELAEAYFNGVGVEQDMKQAFLWYGKAALGGNRASWWQLAECYRLGLGTAINYEEALECYAKAYDLGYHNKLDALLTSEDSEWKGTPFMHYLKGVRLLVMDGNPNAAINEFAKMPKKMQERKIMEALCLKHKDFKKHDVKKAVKMLQKIEQSEPRAAFELALMQMKGEGMSKDEDKAVKTLTKLSKNNYLPAVNYLADCYYEGKGVVKDKSKAKLLYLQAEKLQRLSKNGVSRLIESFKTGEGMKENQERVKELEKYRIYDVNKLLEKVKVVG